MITIFILVLSVIVFFLISSASSNSHISAKTYEASTSPSVLSTPSTSPPRIQPLKYANADSSSLKNTQPNENSVIINDVDENKIDDYNNEDIDSSIYREDTTNEKDLYLDEPVNSYKSNDGEADVSRSRGGGIEGIEGDGMTIVGTADGFIHGVDSNNQRLWSTSTGGPLASHHNSGNLDYSVIPSVDGSILVHSTEGMRKTSVKARMLAEKAPIITPDGLFLTGQKTSRIFSVDLGNGRVLQDTGGSSSDGSGSGSGNGNGNGNGIGGASQKVGGKLKSTNTQSSGKQKSPLWLGRTDYTLRAYDSRTGSEEFNITFSELRPLSQSLVQADHDHDPSANTNANTKSFIATAPLHPLTHSSRHRGKYLVAASQPPSIPVPIISTPDGDLFFMDGSGNIHHGLSLGSPAVNAFNINSIGQVDDVQGLDIRLLAQGLDIRPVRIAHRMYNSDTAASASSKSQAPESSSSTSGNDNIVLVRSLSDGGLYALEMPADTPTIARSLAQSLSHSLARSIAQSEELSALPSPTQAPSTIMGGSFDDGEVSIILNSPTSSLLPPSLSSSNPSIRIPALSHNPSLAPAHTLSSLSSSLNVKRNNHGHGSISISGNNRTPLDSAFVEGDIGDAVGASDADEKLKNKNDNSESEVKEGVYTLLPSAYPTNTLEDWDNVFGPETGNDSVSAKVLPPTIGTIVVEWVRTFETIITAIAVIACMIVAGLFMARKSGVKLPSIINWALDVLSQTLLSIISPNVSMEKSSFSGSTISSDLSTVKSQLMANNINGLGAKATSAVAAISANAVIEAEVEEFDEEGKKIVRIGSLALSPSVILGYGSHGTVVFRGCLNGRPVAIKRMLSQFTRSADREISLLIRSDGHPNVVRYFLREQQGEFVYLALQLCKMSLKDCVVQLQRALIAKKMKEQVASGAVKASFGNVLSISRTMSQYVPDDVVEVPDAARRALLQIAEGVAHLHSQRIVHRDIKPHNILCALPDEALLSSLNHSAAPTDEMLSFDDLGSYILKISDMGLSKQLDKDEGSFASMSMSMPAQVESTSYNSSIQSSGTNGDKHIDHGPVGTIGWQAPELMAMRGIGGIVSITEDIMEDEDGENEAGGEVDDTGAIESGDSSVASAASAATKEKAVEENLDSVQGDWITVEGRGNAVSTSHSKSKSSSSIAADKKSIMSATRRRTQNVDIFSLGCVFHYVLVPGMHPFGQWFEREANIMTGKMDMGHLAAVPDALDLLTRMLQREPEDRPTAAQVCRHPFFWPSSKRLEFLLELSDKLEHEPNDSPLVIALESQAHLVTGKSWDRRMSAAVLEDVGKYRKYDTCSVRDLLRVIRNKKHHFHELSETVANILGPLPVGFMNYFESRFPRLLFRCVEVACTFLANDKGFSQFCFKISSMFTIPIPPPIETAITSMLPLPSSSSSSSSSQLSANSPEFHYSLNRSVSPPPPSAAPYSIDVDAIVWAGSALTETYKCRGWWKDADHWISGAGSSRGGKPRSSHLTRSSTDLKYRTRLCTHWEMTLGGGCPMRKKGKCDFAHGPLELRVKDTRRDKWGVTPTNTNSNTNTNDTGGSGSGSGSGGGTMSLRLSGGEDVLGLARSIEKVRFAEGSVSDFEKTSGAPAGGKGDRTKGGGGGSGGGGNLNGFYRK